MCKVFAMTNVSQFKVNSKFISIVRNEVCRHADQDGFGYAVLSKKGDIGGERTMRPLNFRPLIDPESPKTTKELPIVLDANNSFGKIDLANPKSFIAHGRLSTNSVSLVNTHPFTNGEVALIHNGVVRDPTNTLKNLVSTCDSEILLRYWEKDGIEAIEKMVTGYYAVAILDKNGLLHIIRDDRADLYISYCRTVDSFLIATTSEIINNVAKEMKWKIEHPEEILEKSYTTFDGNSILNHRSITPRTSEYGGQNYYGEDWHKRNSNFSNFGDSSKKNTQPNTTTTTTEDTSEDDKGVTHITSESAFRESDPEREAVPKYRELPGQVAASGSNGLGATTSSGTVDHDGPVRSLADGSTVRMNINNMEHEDRLDAIVDDIQEYRTSRITGSGGA